MFHDLGLTARYECSQLRFGVDGANAAREFLRGRGISESDIETLWTAVALHTTPGIPQNGPISDDGAPEESPNSKGAQ
jgi:hypothetical protein